MVITSTCCSMYLHTVTSIHSINMLLETTICYRVSIGLKYTITRQCMPLSRMSVAMHRWLGWTYGIPSFILKGSCDCFITCTQTLSQKHSPTKWKEAVIMPVYKRGNNAWVQKYKPVSLLKNFKSL